MFAQGYGYKLVSHRIGVRADTVRRWKRIWNDFGEDALFAPCRSSDYTEEQREKAVQERLSGMPLYEVMRRNRITDRDVLRRWVRKHQQKQDAENRKGKG